ncbi:hypothetical protein [Nonomuraea sp. NPDC023979]|uniref:hypothetical protein n=1 Tax=Nonomuraea sp. NPDC023979 TaxID=3154796 RepID=UPI0034061B36
MFDWNKAKVGDYVSWEGDEPDDVVTVKIVGVCRHEDGRVHRISYADPDYFRDAVEESAYLSMKRLTREWRHAEAADVADWEARRANHGPQYTNSWD